MNINDLFPSKWLKKEDVSQPRVVTINRIGREEMNDDGGKKMKAIVVFMEPDVKPMILNKGNGEAIAELYGSDTDAWTGKKIEIYVDPNVMMSGKRVGGLRIRAVTGPQNPPAPAGGWQISDGKTVVKKGTADEVRAYFLELLDMHVAPETRRVRCPDGSVLDGAAWMMHNGSVQQQEDQIPF